ncbi:class I SAM-dependent methyltransferase [Chloroflexota bacterium]
MVDDADWADLYNSSPEIYNDLVDHEDYQGNLLPALLKMIGRVEDTPPEKAHVVEFGAGTGRVTGLLHPHVARMVSADRCIAMMRVGKKSLQERGIQNWKHFIADSRQMPLPNGVADIAIQGWSFLQIAVWQPESWKKQIDRAIGELMRVLKPGGVAILIETLGTGEISPSVPKEFMQAYQYWEEYWRFLPSWIRTDYLFDSVEQAIKIVTPFFGEEMASCLVDQGAGIVLPECTGLWWRRA